MIIATLRPAMSNRASQTATNFDSLASMLFAASEPGAWYDPSDLSTMWQDSAGSTPVTAVEQPVGRILDKSGRGNHATQSTSTKRPTYSRRVNLLTKTEDFAHADWTKLATGTGSAPAIIGSSQAPDGTNTATRVSFDRGAGTASGDLCQLTSNAVNCIAAAYTNKIWLKTSDGTSKVFAVLDPAGTAVLTTITGTWAEYAIPATVGSPASINTVRLRLRGNEATATSATIDIWHPQTTLSIDAHLPHQSVNTATDYDDDPNKFPAYLAFDGVNRAMATGNIDFTSTDKMTVWTGVTKLSDAAAAMLCELSTNTNSSPGSFFLTAPESVVVKDFRFRTRGSASAPTAAGSGGAASPIAAVVTGVGDISGDYKAIRLNGVLKEGSAEDQGLGPFGTYPLYIGARAGTSIYFNGRLYGLIVRGAESTLSQIEAAELYMRQKARMP